MVSVYETLKWHDKKNCLESSLEFFKRVNKAAVLYALIIFTWDNRSGAQKSKSLLDAIKEFKFY